MNWRLILSIFVFLSLSSVTWSHFTENEMGLDRDDDEHRDNIDSQIDNMLRPFMKEGFNDLLTSSALPFVVTINCVANYSTDSIYCHFTFSNNNTKDVYLLTWFTPFEGLLSEFITITHNNSTKLLYDGPNLLRSTPQKDNYILISAGRSASVSVDLAAVYKFNNAGTYEVTYTRTPLYRLSLKDDYIDMIDSNFAGNAVLATTKIIVEESIKQQTVGNMIRAEEQSHDTRNKLSTPNYVYGTNELQDIMTQIHKSVYKLAQAALEALDKDRNHFIKWFGSNRSTRALNAIRDMYKGMLKALEEDQFTYVLDKECMNSGAIVYTYSNSRKVYFCKSLYQYADVTYTSMSQYTKIHIVTYGLMHCISNRVDITYGMRNARDLALTNSKKALENAENHVYFIRSVNLLSNGYDSIESVGPYTFITVGPLVFRYSDENAKMLDCGYPKLIMTNWDNIPGSFADGFDSMFSSDDDQLLITKGAQYIVYTNPSDASSLQGPYSISDEKLQVMSPSFGRMVNAGTTIDDEVVLTSGVQIAFYLSNMTLVNEDDCILSISELDWGLGVTSSFLRGFDAMASLPNGKLHIVRGREFVQIGPAAGYDGIFPIGNYHGVVPSCKS